MLGDLDPPAFHVDGDVAHTYQALAFRACAGHIHATEVRAQPRGQDPGIERLGDVVVGPHLEPDHHVHAVGPTRKHDDRADDPLAAKLAADFDAAQVRQNPVQQNDVRLAYLHDAHRLLSVSGLDNLVAVPPAHLTHDGPR